MFRLLGEFAAHRPGRAKNAAVPFEAFKAIRLPTAKARIYSENTNSTGGSLQLSG
jgi:hypothetical protein